MKQFYKKHKIITIVISIVSFIILVFVIPICINWLYERSAPVSWLNMSWGAKDVLSFYGSLLGAVATILALIATIMFNRESQKEERKLSIKPYLQTNHFSTKNIFNKTFENRITYVSIHITGSEVTDYMPSEIEDLFILKSRYPKDTNYINKYVDEYFEHSFLMIYEIKNYGAGNAVNVKLEIKGGEVYIEDFCVGVSETKKFAIIFDDTLLSDTDPYIFRFNIIYTDVCSLGKYFQSESFKFFRLESGELAFSQANEDFLSAPKEI